MPRYLSTDPNAGLDSGESRGTTGDPFAQYAVDRDDPFAPYAKAYLSRDPNAGDSTSGASVLERFFAPLLPSETPSDYINGPLYALRHPIDSAKLIGSAIASDPIGAIPVVGNVKRAIQDLSTGNYAGAAGEAVAGALAAKGASKLSGGVIPDLTDAIPPAARGVARGTGAVLSGTGRAVEAVGKSAPSHRLGAIGPAIEILQGNPAGAIATAVVPPALEYGGRALQRVGGAIRGLGAAPDIAANDAALVDRYLPNTGGRPSGPPIGWTPRSREVAGFSYTNEPGITGGTGVDSASASPRMVDLDSNFGPGAVDTQGRPAQAVPMKGDEGYIADLDPSHQIFDPTTPSDYLRELRDQAIQRGDLAAARRYAQGLDQRARIGLALEGMRNAPPSGVRVLKVKPFAAPQ